MTRRIGSKAGATLALLMAAGVIAAPAPGDPAAGAGLAWRGNGQGFRVAVQGFNSARLRAITWRMRQFNQQPFRRCRVVIALTHPADTRFSGFIAGDTLTVTAMTSGTLNPGAIIAGRGVATGTALLRQIGGTPGGVGRYQVNLAQQAGSAAGPLALAGPIADSFYPYAMRFQTAVEPRWTAATSGIPGDRPLVTWHGQDSFAYDPAHWDRRQGYAVSDPVDFGRVVPANTPYGIWHTVELPAPAANQIPYTKNASAFLDRQEGVIPSPGEGQIAARVAARATSVQPWPRAQNGAAGPFTPAFLLCAVPAAAPAVGVLGDSIGYMVGEGGAGSGNAGDAEGSARGNGGFIERGLVEHAHLNEAVNLSRGSDKAAFFVTPPENGRYRLQGLKLANPTAVIVELGHNDLAGGTLFLPWSAATRYPAGILVAAGSTLYRVEQAGQSGARPPAGGSPGQVVRDAGLVLRVVAQGASDTPHRSALATFANLAEINHAVHAALGPVPIVQTLVTPDALSGSGFATLAAQHARPGWQGPGAARTLLNQALQALPASLGARHVLDPRPAIEAEGAVWRAGASMDGVHPNSQGHAAVAALVTPALAR
ncbi:SGNH/GDSL hydrolase family protein [Sphingomonas morindae]|uniref:SGNH/GDSL hydrolase family protein n=1 Tax=Sphingomonas morindae TaxID=1541170 RepID=A0ABY4X6G3_9SPHN|nr:SGNH/GDSL hydrolase family protein [Sphingomonas morindae]USI72471.1 SGNH/GDSL hydrolase family protein [Sphingomonas morindae]